mgnify:CR=1 FL=1
MIEEIKWFVSDLQLCAILDACMEHVIDRIHVSATRGTRVVAAINVSCFMSYRVVK